MATSIIRLNVGGTIYQVSKSLLETYPQSMLARLVSDTWKKAEDNEIFIDRNGDRFQYVLDYLREPELFEPDALGSRELDYFGIPFTASTKITLPNLQPGLRKRAMEAGELVCQRLGAIFCRRSLTKSSRSLPSDFGQIGEKVGFDIQAGAGSEELFFIAHMLSPDDLSTLWIPEYGIRCVAMRPRGKNVYLEVSTVLRDT